MGARTCTVDGCDAPHIARGWCHRHYKRWQTHGAPTGVGVDLGPRTTIEQRFWAKVDKGPDCWLWTGADDGQGYGSFYVDGERGRMKAHRVAWMLAGRPFTPGKELDHLCRVRKCVNVEHLEEVTHAVNTERSTGPTAANGRKTHCDKGHPLSGDNLYVPKPGVRNCRTCYVDSQRRYKAKRREARLT